MFHDTLSVGSSPVPQAKWQTVSNLPSIEALEQAHEFPCTYTIKAIGAMQADFVNCVLAGVQSELQLAQQPRHSLKETSGGRHASVTLELDVATPHDVLAVYARIQTLEGLVLIL